MSVPSQSGRVLMVGQELRNAKRALRQRILAARDAMPPPARDAAAAAIARRVIALDSFARAASTLLTLPFRTEWDTRPIVDAALASRKAVVLPRVDVPTRMLVLHAVENLEHDVEPGYLGIPEPRLSCPVVAPERITWVLVPGVAFDGEGRRLGYGGGFYDRLLPLLPPEAVRVAGVFDLQIVDTVPSALHDLAVQTIVSETRLLHPGAR